MKKKESASETIHRLRTHLWLITTELTVAICKTFQTNGELHITASHYILDFEFGELGIES